MTELETTRRLERALADDVRTAELAIRIQPCRDGVVAQGEVMTEERRCAVIEVLRELAPALAVLDELTVTGEDLAPPTQVEEIPARPTRETG